MIRQKQKFLFSVTRAHEAVVRRVQKSLHTTGIQKASPSLLCYLSCTKYTVRYQFCVASVLMQVLQRFVGSKGTTA